MRSTHKSLPNQVLNNLSNPLLPLLDNRTGFSRQTGCPPGPLQPDAGRDFRT